MAINQTAFLEWLRKPVWDGSPLPAGASINLVNPPSLQKYDSLCQTVCLTVTTLLIFVRIYTKSRILKTWGWDDLTSVVAWLGLIAFGVVLFQCDEHGAGKHQWDVIGQDWLMYQRLINAVEITYTLVILTTKVSILLFYLRIFSPSRTVFIIIHFNLWANIIFYIVGFFVEIFQCVPRDGIWNPWVYTYGTKCINQGVLEIAAAVFNTISDFAILVIPISTLWHLNVQKQKKMGILALFATGLFGCIASLVRVILAVTLAAPNEEDSTWDSYSLELWSFAEISAGIICGCMPALPPFCRHLHVRLGKAPEAKCTDQKSFRRGPQRRLRPDGDLEMLETSNDSPSEIPTTRDERKASISPSRCKFESLLGDEAAAQASLNCISENG